MADVAAATGLRYASLRYFNAAGAADPAMADVGESNLVPMVFRAADRTASRPDLRRLVYPTPDGTCVRDFMHVADIASAHVAAATALAEGRVSALTANIGTGTGVSVPRDGGDHPRGHGLAGEAWTEPVVTDARPGDPPRVVASADRIRSELGWQAR